MLVLFLEAKGIQFTDNVLPRSTPTSLFIDAASKVQEKARS